MALVVFFLTFTDGNTELDKAFAAEEFGRYDGRTSDFSSFKRGNLFAGGEELNISGGFSAKSEIVQPKLVVFNSHERAFELNMVITNRTDLLTV